MATNTYTVLATQTLTSATDTVTFANIPQGYTDLQIKCSFSASVANNDFRVRVGNGTIDSNANYSYQYLNGNGSAAGANRNANTTYISHYYSVGLSTSPQFVMLDILNYSSTFNRKTFLSKTGASDKETNMTSGLWSSTQAIDTITLLNNGNTTSSFTVGSSFTIYGIKAEAPAPKATGGAIYTDADYYYHVFGATGAFVPSQNLTADILTVAGGGGGGGARVSVHYAGGGGAGGVLGFASQSLTSGTSYTCTVGAGGTAGAGGAAATNGGTGGNSQFGGLTAAVGGGYGGTASNAGGNGGSGGGGGSYGGTYGGGSGTSGQGYAGGTGGIQAYVSGGGGGAGGVGANSSSTSNGAGGPGVNTVANWGSLLTMFNATGVGVNGYIAGGGQGTVSGSSAALGGGGKAGVDSGGSGATPPVSGAAGSGSGGAAGQANGTQTASAGGSGIVIVRYLK